MGFPYLQTGMQAVELVQGLVDDDKADKGQVRDSEGYSIASGRLVEDVDLVNGSFTTLNHKLGRQWKGYVVVKRSADESVWDQASSDDSLHLDLQASGSVTVSLWVF